MDSGLEVQVFTQWTPNPNAMKFIVSEFVIQEGKAGFQSTEECDHVPLLVALMTIEGVTQVHLYENVVTITQDGSQPWEVLTETVEEALKVYLPSHDPAFERRTAKKSRDGLSADIVQIEEILDRTIRPGLQADGGDVEVIEYKDGVIYIRYEGACGTCPSSMAGTLQAITGFLRAELRPDVDVVAV